MQKPLFAVSTSGPQRLSARWCVPVTELYTVLEEEKEVPV